MDRALLPSFQMNFFCWIDLFLLWVRDSFGRIPQCQIARHNVSFRRAHPAGHEFPFFSRGDPKCASEALCRRSQQNIFNTAPNRSKPIERLKGAWLQQIPILFIKRKDQASALGKHAILLWHGVRIHTGADDRSAGGRPVLGHPAQPFRLPAPARFRLIAHPAGPQIPIGAGGRWSALLILPLKSGLPPCPELFFCEISYRAAALNGFIKVHCILFFLYCFLLRADDSIKEERKQVFFPLLPHSYFKRFLLSFLLIFRQFGFDNPPETFAWAKDILRILSGSDRRRIRLRRICRTTARCRPKGASLPAGDQTPNKGASNSTVTNGFFSRSASQTRPVCFPSTISASRSKSPGESRKRPFSSGRV